MSVRKQEQQRLRRARQQPIIYDEDGSVAPRAPPPELNACLEVVTAALGDPNRALLRRVFHRRGQVKIRVWNFTLPAVISH